MPRAKPFDKRTATTYALVNRPQHDPLINDTDAPAQIFTQVSSSKNTPHSKIKRRHDLENELDLSAPIRDNEGEAAEYGIYYDDSSYDYMQHLRELGASSGSTWIDASMKSDMPANGKGKLSLEDALRDVSLEEAAPRDSLIEDRVIEPSTFHQKYQSQRDVPDTLAGFQPDMDPRLREVLEALEDDEYVDDDDQLFEDLAADGNSEMDPYEWEASGHQSIDFEDEDGWESDDTTKPVKEYKSEPELCRMPEDLPFPSTRSSESGVTEDGSWLASFTRSKGLEDPPNAVLKDPLSTLHKPSQMQRSLDVASSAALTSASQLSRRKKRKGALTSDTGFSMSSSALARTESLSVLDSRLDKIAESYFEDVEEDFDEQASLASGMTSRTNMSKLSAFGGSQLSEAPSLTSGPLDSMFDDFLGGKDGQQKGKTMKKAGRQGRWGMQSGMEQLDEIRHGLGPARIKSNRTETSKV